MSIRIPLLPGAFRWLPAVGVAGLICYWSLLAAPPTAFSPPALLSAGPSDVTTAGFGSLALPVDAPLTDPQVRHATAYATLALALAYGFGAHELSIVRKAVFVFVIAVGYGVLMEFGQLFQPERTASLLDVAANTVGAAAALSWYGLESRVSFVPVFASNSNSFG